MLPVRLSRRAEADLLNIAAYTFRTWGEAQTIRYLDGIEACCRGLAGDPPSGRTCDQMRPGLRRIEHGKHVVFFRIEKTRILVSRILHERMLPEIHAIGSEADEA